MNDALSRALRAAASIESDLSLPGNPNRAQAWQEVVNAIDSMTRAPGRVADARDAELEAPRENEEDAYRSLALTLMELEQGEATQQDAKYACNAAFDAVAARVRAELLAGEDGR